ncbi:MULTISPECIES: alpha/beta hydrolase [Thermomonosporaceae]|uniref:alpha/beta hydrolase n=1 Tax=Thermomonosporaceae TaxID=2012 RepID=UPI00255AD229|nr:MULTISPECIES: alpha/beta hydrolase [Thermomonosporaceae]MDL4776438.1 alpha/beta hydrolase [Actinomadura xylanilytica]
MPLHPQAARFLDLIGSWTALGDGGGAGGARAAGTASGAEPSIDEMRRRIGAVFPVDRRELPRVRDLSVRGEDGAAVPARLYRPEPPAAGPLPLLVYLHGGGWVLGGVDNVDAACRELAAGAGCAVLNVGYRLAPEHPFPAAVDDAWTALAAVAADPGRYGAVPGALAVAGDSAGGNLAAAAALMARDRGVALAHQLLVYPVTDTAMDTASWSAFGSGYGLDADAMARFMGLYRGAADPADPRLAPLRAADLSGLAPATVVTAEYDILRDEGEAYARRLADAGVPVRLRRFDGVVHSFFLLPEIFDAGAEAMRFAVRRLRTAFGTPIQEGGAA